MYISTGVVEEILAQQLDKPENAALRQELPQDARPLVVAEEKTLVANSYLAAEAVDSASPQQNAEFQDLVSQLPKALKISGPDQDQYNDDIYHWATSSTQASVCTVQPETAEDVSSIMKFINQYRKPDGSRMAFGIKSGGHTGNPGFSSTSGILISMKRFDQVIYDSASQTAVIGAGQIWDNVYEKLAQHDVTVLGARVTHIGVAGFILGGGYSWKTNQYGLAIDTVTAFELVKPDGTIVNVTEASDADLFFGLRGGGNNFGAVTKFTMKTFPQGKVWGGPVLLTHTFFDNSENEERLKKFFVAVQTFIDTVNDPKAAIIVSLGTATLGPVSVLGLNDAKILNVIAFYDGPTPPAGIFDVFKTIAPKETGEGWKERTYLDLVQSAMDYDASRYHRGAFHTVALSHYTPELVEKIWQRNDHWHSQSGNSHFLLSYSVEPFLRDILSKGSASAYPPDRSIAYSPFPIYISWTDPDSDSHFQEFAKTATKEIEDAAAECGIKIGPRYSNYAITGTPLEEIYGKNIEKLKKTKERVDPDNIMGLAGGFRF